ncbi:hypothetical protein [Phycicoccus endophyticus]|nr:hypothetical protein [Phycicoccus endophyticus]
MAVSADAVFAATVAWGAAALAAATAATGVRRGALAVVAGLLLGWAVMESYGLVLAGLLAVGVLLAARVPGRARAVAGALCAGAALAVVLGVAAAGFAWWEAFPVLHDRYRAGLASSRPAGYWVVGNLGAFVLAAGLLLPAGVGAAAAPVWRLTTRAGRAAAAPWERAAGPLLAAGGAMVLLADVSLLSKAEVERIWLPFLPWLMLGVLWLPPRWRRWGLPAQAVLGLLLAHTVDTVW